MSENYEPRPVELSRRIDEISARMDAGFSALHERLDKMPTSELLMAHLSKSEAEMRALRADIEEAREATSQLRAEMFKGDSELSQRVETVRTETANARRWSIGVAISVGTLVLGALAAVAQAVGGA